MGDWLRLILLILLGGAGVTLAAWLAMYFMAEERRLARAFRLGLGGPPDAALIARGSGTYPLEELLGAELDLDGEVAARALRGEPRRLLDRQSGAEREVRLRFLFDDARHPDFELVLWPPQSPRGGPARPREAIAEANRWIARIEAVLRKTGGALLLAKPAAPTPVRSAPAPRPAPPDLFYDDEGEDEELDADELAD